MNKLPLAVLLAALSVCGAAAAQSTTNGTSDPNTGTTHFDTSGSATLPADLVPPAMTGPTSTSGTSAASGTPRYSADFHIPTRNEVRAEAAAMVRAGTIPRGELSTAFQDKGAQLGSTPF